MSCAASVPNALHHIALSADPGFAKVHPTYLDSVETVNWLNDSALWAPAVNSPLDNIWYIGSRLSPIYKARRLNATRALPFTLPPLRENDVIYMHNAPALETEQSREWSQAFLEVATGLSKPRVETPKTPWGAALSPKNLQCWKKAILTGTFGQVVRAVIVCTCGVCMCAHVRACGVRVARLPVALRVVTSARAAHSLAAASLQFRQLGREQVAT